MSGKAKRENAPGLIGDAARYLGISVAALGADYAMLLVLHRGAGLHYLLAASLAFIVGLAIAWALSVTFVFSGRRKLSPMHEFGGFVVTGLAGLVLTQAVLFVLVGELALPAELAKIPAAGLTFVFNFVSRRTLLFITPVKATV